MVADNPPSRLLPTAPRRHAADRCPTASVRRIGHQGLRHDAPAAGGLIYNRHRMLHPAAGRFVQRDPLDQNQPGRGYHDGMGLYQYVASNPPIATDQAGLKLCLDGNARNDLIRTLNTYVDPRLELINDPCNDAQVLQQAVATNLWLLGAALELYCRSATFFVQTRLLIWQAMATQLLQMWFVYRHYPDNHISGASLAGLPAFE